MAKSGTIPEGTYKGKIVEIGELSETEGEKATPFFPCICEITEDGDWKGKRLAWTAFVSEGARTRTYQAFIGSGCTFPNGDPLDFTGFGSKEQELQVEHQKYTPKPTEAEPNPAERTVARVAFVNNGPMGMKGKVVDTAKKAGLAAMFKASLKEAQTGDTEPAADGTRVVGGKLKDKSGKEMF